MLTVEKLKEMEPGTIIARGIIKNNPEGYFVTREFPDRDLMWVAKRGGYHDWAIYYGWAERYPEDNEFVPIGESMILSNGDKMYGEHIIRKCVECDDEAFKMYRN